MLGMAGMFVGTILLGLVIRPFYDANQLQAFGESGSTQVRYVMLELLMIFIFTAAILFLVRMGAQWVIKYGVMGILALALMYTTVPLAHVLLVDDPGVVPFASEEENRPDGHIVADLVLTMRCLLPWSTTTETGRTSSPPCNLTTGPTAPRHGRPRIRIRPPTT